MKSEQGLQMSNYSGRMKITKTTPRRRCKIRRSSNDLIKTINVCLKNSPRFGLITLALILMATRQLASSAASSRSSLKRPVAYELPEKHYELSRLRPITTPGGYHDLAAAEQLDEPMTLDPDGPRYASLGLDHEQSPSDDNYALGVEHQAGGGDEDDDEAMENSNERTFLNNHQSQLRAMRDLFERRQLNQANNNNNNERMHHSLGQSSQELSPISIGLDPGSPFSMPPFGVGGEAGAQPPPPMMAPHPKAHMAPGPAQLDPGGGPGLAFGLNPLPHLLGFQNSAFDGPQRGDQSAHHAAASSQSAADPEIGPSQKVWPKIFRFTDGRINLSDFEKQKKIALSNKGNRHENHIESAPIMFDGRPLKRKSFLILHGGVFPGN